MCVTGSETVLHQNDGLASLCVAAPEMEFIYTPGFLSASKLTGECMCVVFCPVDSLCNGINIIDNFWGVW